MKKLFMFLFAAFVTTATMVSCSGCGSKNETDAFQEPPMFTKADTTQLLDSLDKFTTLMKAGDIKNAISMIYFLNKDHVEKPDPINLKRQIGALMMIRGIDYQLDYFMLNSEIDNEAKIDIVLFEKKADDTRPNTTSFYFRPVRRGGQWYLTTKDNITDTRSDLRNKKKEAEVPETENAEEGAEE